MVLALAFIGMDAAWASEGGSSLQAASGGSVDLLLGESATVVDERGFSSENESVLADGIYSLYTKLAPTRNVVAIPSGSVRSGVHARLARATGVIGQRFKVTYVGDGAYGIQAASGMYLADRNGSVVQQPRPKSGELAKSQKWLAASTRSGISFSNAASGRNMAVAGGKARVGAQLRTVAPSSSKAQKFRLARESYLVGNGLYSFESRARSLRLDVASASWHSGANVQVWKKNTSIAQKFRIVHAGNGYCRIVMALSGTVLKASGASGQRANVCMGRRSASASQLWKARISDNGVEFVNKATGKVLAIAGRNVAAGRNVRVARDEGKTTQAWRLAPTTVEVGAFDNLRALVENASSGGNRGIRVDSRQSGYKMSASCRNTLTTALGQAWRRGEDISFVMVDLKTGATVSVGPDRSNHGASTFKAAYVTYLFQNMREKGRALDGGTSSLMAQTIGYSSNDAYMALRAKFGTGGFRSWLEDVGLGGLANDPYPRLTARKLALVWSKIYSYEQSGGRHVGEWRRLFNHSYFSVFREALSGSNTVYSKPGWYPKVSGYDALNDAAIVKDRQGGSYLVAALSNTSCYSEKWIMADFARAVNAVHRDMRR